MPAIETTVLGEWQWLCLIFEQLCRPFTTVRFIGKARVHYIVPDIEGMGGEPPVIQIEVQDIIVPKHNWAQSVRNKPDQGVHGSVAFSFYGQLNHTRIIAEYEHPDDEGTCKRLLGIVAGAALEAQKYKTEGEKIKAERVIDHYYDVKRQGGNVTLAQLARSYGFNESYLRQAHQKYKRENNIKDT